MISAAIYARVSSARQKKDQTIGSQTAALREHAAQNRLEVPPGRAQLISVFLGAGGGRGATGTPSWTSALTSSGVAWP